MIKSEQKTMNAPFKYVYIIFFRRKSDDVSWKNINYGKKIDFLTIFLKK